MKTYAGLRGWFLGDFVRDGADESYRAQLRRHEDICETPEESRQRAIEEETER